MESRWKHSCPSCSRTILWRKVYCRECIAVQPARTNFMLRSEDRWLKLRRLTGVPNAKGPFLLVFKNRNELMCVACGKTRSVSLVDNSGLGHRCYWRDIPYAYVYRKVKCLKCGSSKNHVQFAHLLKGKSKIRSRVCADCLRKSKVVMAA